MNEDWLEELEEYCKSWLESKKLNPNSDYYDGAGKVASKVLMRIEQLTHPSASSTSTGTCSDGEYPFQ